MSSNTISVPEGCHSSWLVNSWTLDPLSQYFDPEVHPVFQSIFHQYGSKDTMGEHAECLAKSKVNSIHCSPHVYKVTCLITESCPHHQASSVPWKGTNPQRSLLLTSLNTSFSVLQTDRQNLMKNHWFPSLSNHFVLVNCLFMHRLLLWYWQLCH